MVEERLLSFKDVAARLSVSVRGVYRLVDSRQLPPPVKVGHASRFPESELHEYMARIKNARKRK